MRARLLQARRVTMSASPVKPQPPATPAKPAAAGWTPLGLPPAELALHHTLPTGQSFRWRSAGAEHGYVGVIGRRVVQMADAGGGCAAYRVLARAPDASPADDDAIVRDYVQASVALAPLAARWAAADPGRYGRVARVVSGARVLRQDPLECLISFILSSNNGITRITSLVQKLCVAYGDELLPPRALPFAAAAPPSTGVLPHAHADAYHAFPTLDQLAAADEEELRGMGLGYRARFVTGTVAALRSKPGGGDAWLASLRAEPSYPAVAAALTALPGVGPKVAACAALFSLDARGAVPVDTHVWQLAVKHYTPGLKGKALTPALAEQVADALVGVFGEYAGWAHNALFIAELPAAKAALAALQKEEGGGGGESSDEGGRESESSDSGPSAAAGDWAPDTPAGKRARRGV